MNYLLALDNISKGVLNDYNWQTLLLLFKVDYDPEGFNILRASFY